MHTPTRTDTQQAGEATRRAHHTDACAARARARCTGRKMRWRPSRPRPQTGIAAARCQTAQGATRHSKRCYRRNATQTQDAPHTARQTPHHTIQENVGLLARVDRAPDERPCILTKSPHGRRARESPRPHGRQVESATMGPRFHSPHAWLQPLRRRPHGPRGSGCPARETGHEGPDAPNVEAPSYVRPAASRRRAARRRPATGLPPTRSAEQQLPMRQFVLLQAAAQGTPNPATRQTAALHAPHPPPGHAKPP